MAEWMEFLSGPLGYDYLLRAIWVSAMIGVVCGFLSAFITLKGWSLMGDALSHAVVPGVSLAYLAGLPFAVGAFVAGMIAAGGMALVKAKSRIREDASIGIVFTAFFAIGLILISLFPARVDLKSILLGNMLGIANADIIQLVAISVVTLLVLALKWRDLMLYCFDERQARALGMNPGRLHLILMSLLAATSVAALQAVGACLVVAMLVTPGATAYLLTDRFGRMACISMAIGLGCSVTGAYLSYWLGETGGCIVTLQTLVFLLVFLFAPKQGYLAHRFGNSRKEVHP
ncbi:MAG: metal ABC transporter permease [Akkermansiaceae bacterium]|nr:metal ABC transporter permease [Akkermansiaceae bacterium]